ncbi:hypothetical protein LEP1GSC115_4930 [Leptospira interrogans serovar Australis str. 200703203]|uniref:Uncharacterized protein n=1 Tax=Leptospira interrogans serovar Australis str. 200703203 TaxID=1085541 RepID=N1UQ31_LEPIR|nr:hypothetical protein LEP1GSC115_4930 [Leptospira interrogans serovar Australis str. 200703203]
MIQKIKEQWAVFILIVAVPILHIGIGTENTYIADSALKAMQTDSLIQNNFQSEEIRYPAEKLDPLHEAFFFREQVLQKKSKASLSVSIQ